MTYETFVRRYAGVHPSIHAALEGQLNDEIGGRVPNWSADFDAACELQSLRNRAHWHHCAAIGLPVVLEDDCEVAA